MWWRRGESLESEKKAEGGSGKERGTGAWRDAGLGVRDVRSQSAEIRIGM